MKLILASASPRRKELLKQIGLEFEAIAACGEEISASLEPQQAVTELSRQKAEEIAQKRKGFAAPELILGADTAVAFMGQILGKPKDKADAHRMLSMLQGNRHKVFTGVTFAIREETSVKFHSFYEETQVELYPVTEQEIHWYIGTKEPFDKAGGYGIQGLCAMFVKEIQGDYNNVVGLPLSRVYHELLKCGIDILKKQ